MWLKDAAAGAGLVVFMVSSFLLAGGAQQGERRRSSEVVALGDEVEAELLVAAYLLAQLDR